MALCILIDGLARCEGCPQGSGLPLVALGQLDQQIGCRCREERQAKWQCDATAIARVPIVNVREIGPRKTSARAEHHDGPNDLLRARIVRILEDHNPITRK